MKKYWLLKSEPATYGWDDLERLGEDHWDGVRNYQARNLIREMSAGDQAFFYHSGKEKQIVGVVDIVSGPYPDPTIDDERWSAVTVRCSQELKRPIGLAEIKSSEQLADMVLVKNSRLSVQPVTDQQFHYILNLSVNP